MKKLLVSVACWCLLLSGSYAQTAIDKTLETFSFALGTIGLGVAENDFFLVKTALKKPEPSTLDFRDEVLETIQKNNLNSITYYFDAEGERPLYELIIEFADDATCHEMAEKMLGAPNYPDKPDHWIAGAQDNIVTVAWKFDNKLVIAANFPGTEWFGDALFTVPAGFEMYNHLPGMSEWPEVDFSQFLGTLEKQIAAASDDFAGIRGMADADGYYPCEAPIHGAESATIFKNDDGKWVVGNTVVSGANAENSILWKLDAGNVFSKTETGKSKLVRTKSKPAFGTTIDLWDITDKAGKSTGVQLGLLHYEWGAEGLWNIDILVMQQ